MPRHCSFGCVPGTPPMHRFPNLNKFPERFKTWVNLVGGKLETESHYASYREKRVCDRHFTHQERNRYGRLNVLAVPSLHLGAPLHSFPNPNKFPERFKAWVNLVGGKLEAASDYAYYSKKRVCDRHFTDKERNRFNRLNALAVPSLNFFGASLKKVDSGQNVVKDEVGLDNDCENVADARILVDTDDDCQVVSDDDELSLYPRATKEDDNKELDQVNELHGGFKCDFCSGAIKGFRYTCVQCLNYDLCGSCEANGAHCAHYVLRIPSPRPFAEIQSVLSEIRKQLLYGVWKQADTQADAASDTEIKEEVKDEDELDPLRSDGALSPAASPSQRDTHTDTEDDECALQQSKVKTRPIKSPRAVMNKQKHTAAKKNDDVPTTRNTVHMATKTLNVPSASPRVLIVGKHDVDNDALKTSFQVLSDTVLPSTSTVDMASSDITGTSNKVPVNAQSKRKMGDVSKRVLVLQNNAMKRMKVVLVPLPKQRKVLANASDLSTGETSRAGHPGVTTPVRMGPHSATPPPHQDEPAPT